MSFIPDYTIFVYILFACLISSVNRDTLSVSIINNHCPTDNQDADDGNDDEKFDDGKDS